MLAHAIALFAFLEIEGGGRLWYHDSGGAGAPVVFLHAATGTSDSWEFQEALAIAAGYRFIAYDRRGHGRSSNADQTGSIAGDLELLRRHLGIERLHLVGTAAGGGAAFDYALAFPERVRSLVIANSLGGVVDAEYAAMGRRLRPSPQFGALPPEFRELGPSYRAENPEGVRRWLALVQEGRPPAQKARERITFERLAELAMPTLLLTGDADLYTPPAVLRLFTARMKGAQSAIVPECGHSAFWERPEVFNRAVLEFLKAR